MTEESYQDDRRKLKDRLLPQRERGLSNRELLAIDAPDGAEDVGHLAQGGVGPGCIHEVRHQVFSLTSSCLGKGVELFADEHVVALAPDPVETLEMASLALRLDLVNGRRGVVSGDEVV